MSALLFQDGATVGQNDQQVLATVPRLHIAATGRDGWWRAVIARRRGDLAVALVGVGLVATTAWGGLLAWGVFSFVRWTIG